MEKAGLVLERILAATPAAPGVAIFGRWAQIVGPEMAAHVRVVDLLGDQVVVEVDHPGWGQLIHARSKAVLRSINNLYPQLEFRRLQLRYRQEAQPAAPRRQKRHHTAGATAGKHLDSDERFSEALRRLGKSIRSR